MQLRRALAAVAGLWLVAGVEGQREKTIYAESVQSCSNTSIIKADLLRAIELDFDLAYSVRNFDLQYFLGNNTLRFDIQGQSLRNNVRPTINARVIAYGLDVVEFNFDVCSVLAGGLCPLPTYNFSAAGEYTLPNGTAPDLPGIAYSIPNLEAVATVTLIDNVSGEVASCLDVTLSNGWTTGFSGVAWAAGGIAIAAFVASMIHSLFPLSPHRAGPEWRFFTLLSFYQWIAVCGMLSLDYPGLYQVFTTNFAWAMGLIQIDPIAESIDRMRLRNGGRNVTGDSFDAGSLSYSFGTLPRSTISNAAYAIRPVQDSPVREASRGIAQYVEQVGISYPNTFVMSLVVFLLFCAVVLALLLMGLVVLAVVLRVRGRNRGPEYSSGLKHDYAYASITNLLRVLLVGVFPLALFAMYTFRTVPTSGWSPTLLAGLTLAVMLIGLIGIALYSRRIAKSHRDADVEERFEAVPGRERYSKRWAALYSEFKPAFWWSFMPIIAVAFARGAFVAFAQGSPWTQTIGLAVIELLTFLALCIFRPFRRRGTNALEIILAIVRLFSVGFLMVFIGRLDVNRFVVTGLGAGLLAIQSLIVLLFFALTIFNLGAGILWARKGRRKDEATQPLPWEEKQPAMMRESSDDNLEAPQRPVSADEVTLTEDSNQPWTVDQGEKAPSAESTKPSYVYAMPGHAQQQDMTERPFDNMPHRSS